MKYSWQLLNIFHSFKMNKWLYISCALLKTFYPLKLQHVPRYSAKNLTTKETAIEAFNVFSAKRALMSLYTA